MAQWNQVQSGINTRGISSLMGQAQSGISDVGKVAGDYLLRQERADREAQRQKERQQDVDFRQAQADIQADQWKKSFGLQEAQDKRAGTEFDRKLLGEQRLAEYTSRIKGGLERGEMSQANADKANALLNMYMDKNGMSAEEAGAKVFGTYDAKGNLVKAGEADKLLQFSAPKGTAAQLAYIRGAGFEAPDYDASKLLDYQAKMAAPLEQKLLQDERLAQDTLLTKMKIAADKANTAARIKADRELNDKRTIFMKDKEGNIIYDTVRTSDLGKYVKPGSPWQLGGNIDRAPKAEKSDFKLFGTSKESGAIDLDFFGSGDTEKARLVGQRLQDTYGLTPDEVGIALQAATGGWLDKSIDRDKLANYLYTLGAKGFKGGANTSTAKKTLDALLADIE